MTSVEKKDPQQVSEGWEIFAHDNFTSQSGADSTRQPVHFLGEAYVPGSGGWKTNSEGATRLVKAYRFLGIGKTLRYRRKFDDFRAIPINNLWDEFRTSGFADTKVYVVQTNPGIVQRCLLMATDPGDLVLDPTCGSGTTAYVAEQWGRRWITFDTSRIALALARARLMGARYPYYRLADSADGRRKEAELTGRPPLDTPTRGDLRQGFVYERAPHITLKSIANNAEIDVIWEAYQDKLEPLREQLNAIVGKDWEEWEIPRDPDESCSDAARKTHAEWWTLRIARQREIDKSIAQKADVELLYDRPYEDTSTVRVSGLFTVESLSPHRVVPADKAELIKETYAVTGNQERKEAPLNDFTQMVLENLQSAGVHQAAKDDRITFASLEGWPGGYIAAEGHFMEGETEKRAAIFIGPEFGTVTRADLTAAAREALDARFDVLIVCGFNFDAHV